MKNLEYIHMNAPEILPPYGHLNDNYSLLFSTQSEALEFSNLQFRISSLQHFSYCLLAIQDIFLVQQANFLQELSQNDP